MASTNLIWITDKRHANSSISIVPLKAVYDLAKSHLVLHSLYQTGEKSSSLPHNARTATTILGEAIYQLLCRYPDGWQKLKIAPNHDRNPPLENSMNHLADMLDEFYDINAISGRAVVYWLVDRIDTIFWRTDNSSLGLLEGPPQVRDLDKAERKQIARASSTLESFLGCLNSLTRCTDRLEGARTSIRERKWELRVLVSSNYEISALRRGSHGSDEDISWGPGNWVDLVV